MACKLIYKGIEFDTEDQILDYISDEMQGDAYDYESIAEEYEHEDTNESEIVLQTTTEPSKASASTLKKVNEFLKRIGVNVKGVNRVTVDGVTQDANAVADLTNQLIQVVEGKQDVALTEEAMHFAVEIIAQTNPGLFKDMMNKIGQYQIYNDVLNDAGYRKLYALPDGKIDVAKMKKEAIGKLMAEQVINMNEGSTEKPELLQRSLNWWQQIVQWLKNKFNIAEFNPFEQAAEDFIGDRIDGVATGEGQFYQTGKPVKSQDDLYNSIKAQAARIALVPGENGRSNYQIDGKEIKNRVTDLAKEFYEKTFRNKEMSQGEASDAVNEMKAEKGTKGHADLEALFHKYIDDDGVIRETPLATPPSQLNPTNPAFINKLDIFMNDLLASYPKGTKFLSETTIYDAAKDRAGTMDFIAILPDGTTDIRDWKFMDLPEKANDVPWYKKKAFDIQIGEYKRILNKSYGVSNFRYTRAIPIRTIYRWDKNSDKKSLILSNIIIGNVDVKKITDLSLLPVATKDESTGNKKLDELIQKLNALYDKLKKESVKGDQRLVKIEKLNGLERAIRTLQIQQSTVELSKSAAAIISSVKRDIDNYTEYIAEHPKLTKEERNNISEKILEDYDVLQLFDTMKKNFKDIDITPEEEIELEAISSASSTLIDDIDNLRGEVGEIIANGFDIKDLLNPEKVLGWLSRNYRSLSQAGTKATRVLWRMQERLATGVKIESDEAYTRLHKLKTTVEEAAKAKGIKTTDFLRKMMGKNKQGKWNGELIRKISSDFYRDLKDAQGKNDKKWIEENIDMEAYKQDYETKLASQIEYIEGQTFSLTDAELNVAERKRRLTDYKDRYSPTGKLFATKSNDRLRLFPKEANWTSNEYKEMAKEPSLLEFYNYWQEKMKASYVSGMFQDLAYSRFVPNVKKSMLEKVFDGTRKAKGERQFDYLGAFVANLNEDVVRDPFTGQPVQKIGPAYLYDLGENVTLPSGEEYTDYSDKSDDLFKVMAIWENQMAKFKYRTEIEAEARLIQSIEQRKSTLVPVKGTSELVVTDDNTENSKYYDNFMNAVLYGRKLNEGNEIKTTIQVGKYVRGINAAFKKYAGFEPLPNPERETITIGGTKTIEAMNRWFQMKTMGLNVMSSISNFAGGTANAYINSEKWFSKKELFENETRLVSAKFQTKEGNIYAGLLDYFIPLTDDEQRDKSKKLSVKGTAANLSSDWLFSLMRGSDRFVQVPIFWAFCQNTMLENGELVNIREFVRNQNNYDTIYQMSPTDRQILKNKIENEVDELKKTRALDKIGKIVNDEFVIEGLTRNSDTVSAFRNQVQQVGKDVLGNMDPNDIAQYRMNVLMKSVMMFKNWIPRMVDARFGNLRYEEGKRDWDWGRINMVTTNLWGNLANGVSAFLGNQSGREGLITTALGIYEKKRAEIGEDFMSEAAFVDMYSRAATATIREMLMTLALLGMFAAAKAAVPDDDDDALKGAHKWSVRVIDRAFNELAFFYNPMSASQIANGSMFPALGLLIDIQKLAQTSSKDAYYQITGNEKGTEKTHTTKALFKTMPILKEIGQYTDIFNHELAKEYGVVLSTQSRPQQ